MTGIEEDDEIESSASDKALFEYLRNNNVNVHDLINEREQRMMHFIRFNSNTKRELAVLETSDPSKIRLYAKGASELIIRNCTNLFNKQSEDPMTEQMKSFLIDEVCQNTYGKKGMRSVAFAYRDMPLQEYLEIKETGDFVYGDGDMAFSKGLTFVCVVGMEDKIKNYSSYAVQVLQNTGIRVRIVTGDKETSTKVVA